MMWTGYYMRVVLAGAGGARAGCRPEQPVKELAFDASFRPEAAVEPLSRAVVQRRGERPARLYAQGPVK
jgi:hypothetical protein